MDERLQPSFAQLRVIALAVTLGPVLLGAVLLYLTLSGELQVPIVELGVPWLDVGAAVLGVGLFGMAFAVRGVVVRAAHAQSDPVVRHRGYTASVIVFFALVETGMLVNLLAVLFVAPPWTNVAIVGVGLALALNFLPSEQQFAGMFA